MPSDPANTNPFNEIRNIEAVMLRRRGIEAQVSQFTPTSAALYANYARDYPWMQPGVVRAASMAGYYPNNPDMVRVAATSLAEAVASGRINTGSRTRASELNPGRLDPQLEASGYLPSRPPPELVDDPLKEYRAKGYIDEDNNLVRPARPKYSGRRNGKPVWEYESDEDRQADKEFKDLLRLISDNEGSTKPIPFMQDGDWYNFHPKTGNTEVIKRGDIRTALLQSPINRAGSVPVLGEAIQGVQNVVEPAYQVVQPVARTAGMIANAPIQEIQTTGRALHDAVGRVQREGFAAGLKSVGREAITADLSETDIAIATEGLLSGEDIDTGSGFFVSPTSEVAKERMRREAEHGQIGGHNITWGRWIASAVTEPDTVPFDVMSGFVDFSIQLADPTSVGLGKAGQIRKARGLFEAEALDPHLAAGILGSRGRRPFVDFTTAQKVFDSPRGARAVEDITSTTSAYQIAKKLNSGKLEFKHDPALYDDLARTTESSETRAILTDAIDRGEIREVADVTSSWGHGIAAHVRPHMPRSRLMDKMPGIGTHLRNPVETMNQVMRSFRNVNAPEEALEEAFNKLSTARTKSGRRNTIMEIFGSGPNSLLAQHNIPQDVADQMMRLYKTSFNEMWRGLVDEMGVEVPTWEKMLANGEETLIPGPHALIELVEDWMPFPDPRALREITRRFPTLTSKLPEDGALRTAVELPGAFVDYMLQEVWKPLALARGAWLVRVLGEGQIRIAADGLDSLFSGHPLEALGFMLSKKKIPTGKIPGLRDIAPRIPKSIQGEKWDEVLEYDSSLSKVHNWAHRPGAAETTTQTTLYAKGRHADQEYLHAWARQLMKFNYDPVYSRWINSNSLDEMMDWMQHGEGRGFVRELQEAFPGNLETPAQLRTYLDQIDQRFQFLAKGNTDIFDTLRSGEWTDAAGETHSIYRSGSLADGNPELNPEFTKYLSQFMDDGPNVVVGRMQQALRGKSDYPALKRYAVQNFLYGAMSKSENLLARGSVFRQQYGRELSDFVQFGTKEAREQLISKARSLNVPNRTLKHMEHLARTKVEGKLNLDEIDMLAKGRAMDKSQKLLYSYAERRQIFDITRNFFPFGDAWFEVMSTWGRLTRETMGKPVRRGQQIIEGSINSGFFHENRFGELSFTYPWVGALTSAITGAPIDMEGRVQGLSMFGEIMPGLGPVAQIPAAWFLKDKPELEALEEVLLPFGAPEGEEITDWKTYAPGWLKTALSAVGIKTNDDKRLYENTVAQRAQHLMSTGEYGYTAAEQARVWQDAKASVDKVYWIRSIAQFWLPAAPSLEWYVEDKSGKRLSAVVLAEEFHKMDSEDFDTSVATFVEKYGEDAIGALVAASATAVPGFPDSKEGQAWIDDNPELAGKYPLVYALFAPSGEFDIDTYTRQFASGDRRSLSAKQQIAMSADWLNRYWRSKLMDKMGVNSYADMDQEQRNAWEELSALVDEEYPSAVVGRMEKPEIDDMIKQLEVAGQDKDILATPAGPALTEYLQLRVDAQGLVDALKERGAIDQNIKGFTKAKALRPIREALRSEAQALIDKYPAFQPLWEQVFSRELIKE